MKFQTFVCPGAYAMLCKALSVYPHIRDLRLSIRDLDTDGVGSFGLNLWKIYSDATSWY